MLKHVSFVTPRADAVIAFYTALGAQVSKDQRSPDGLRRVVLSFQNGGKLQFFEAEGVSPAVPHSWMEHVALELADLSGTVERLRESGAQFSRDLHTSPSGKPIAFVLDPDGRQVELLQGG